MPPANKYAQDAENAITGIGCWVGLLMLICGGYWLWQQADNAGWVPHDILAVVTSRNWAIGEYKNCTQANITATKDEPQIDCTDGSESGEPKRFKVRFSGVTYEEELKDKASFIWRCKKTDGTDPSFTCDDRKTITWDKK